jgi:DNA-binding transcriptional MerR regulator
MASLGARNMNARKKSSGKKTDEIFIPDKLYFRIGEVATLCRLPAYVLRFWESEFPQLKPVKSSTGQRMYRRRDVENVLRIKQLLYEQGFTIVGARQQLRSEAKTDKGQAAIPFPAQSTLHTADGIIAPIAPVRNTSLHSSLPRHQPGL